MATRAEQQAALRSAYEAQTQALRDSAVAILLGMFLAGQFRDVDVARFLPRAVPFVQVARRQMSALTAAYLQQSLSNLGEPLRAPAKPIDTSLLRGVDAAQVYTRPFVTVRTELSVNDNEFTKALEAGEQRLEVLIRTDLQLAKTQTAQATLSKGSERVLYKRVLRGEHDCVKCILTSTRIYSREHLLAIHPGCDCDVEPISDIAAFKAEAARVLEDAHDLVAQNFGDEAANPSGVGYSDLIVTHLHGEYGPTLSRRGDHFTGPSAVPAA